MIKYNAYFKKNRCYELHFVRKGSGKRKKLVNLFNFNLFLRLGWWSITGVIACIVWDVSSDPKLSGDGLKQRMTHSQTTELLSLRLTHLSTDFLQGSGSDSNTNHYPTFSLHQCSWGDHSLLSQWHPGVSFPQGRGDPQKNSLVKTRDSWPQLQWELSCC